MSARLLNANAPARKIFYLISGWLLLLACAPAITPTQQGSQTPPPAPVVVLKHFTEQNATLEQVLAKAAAERKPVMIDFYAVWCGPCKWMDQNVFADPEVATYYNKNFVAYKVNAEDFEGVNTALKYAVGAYPTFVFLSPAGQVLHRIEGMTPRESFMQVSRQVLSEM